MNDTFTLPQDITTVGTNFCAYMFDGCSGDAYNMVAAFNLPETITTVGERFVCALFQNCSGDAFFVNEIFVFPKLAKETEEADLKKTGVFSQVFKVSNAVPANTKQSRTCESIINGNSPPPADLKKRTFADTRGANEWPDYNNSTLSTWR
jgi:hypothetical protein